MRNVDLEVRSLYAAAAGITVDAVYSDTRLDSAGDADTVIWFWSQLEEGFDIAVTKAQRLAMPTVGQVVEYLKIRLRTEETAHA